MKKYLSTVVLSVILIISALVFFYPNISDYWNSQHQSRVIADYAEGISTMKEEDYSQIIDEAKAYNQKLASLEKPSYANGSPIDEEYQSLLNLNGNDMMGYITIEKIDVDLPIYHGTSDDVLAVGTGHLEGSSLPIGGESTHSVITGHRGLATATLFTNLDKIKKGDIFTLSILSEVLTYKVDQILIVEPEELENVSIIEGEDHCTLVTCTPFGVNTHRILVRGERIDNIETEKVYRVIDEATLINPLIVAPFILLPMLLILLILLFTAPMPNGFGDD